MLALLVAAPALAQYVATPLAGVPYPALTASTPVTLTVDGGVPNLDRGRAIVPLGFTFPFYDRNYTSVTVTANGLAFFEPDPDSNANYILNFALPNTTAPNGLLAPFWDDLIGNNPGSAVRSQALNGTNGNGLAIEWNDWNREFGAYSLTFQLRLWENGIIEFLYGTMEGNGAALSATIGIESPTGGAGTAPFACGALCTLSSLSPPNPDGGAMAPGITYLKFGPPPGVDLQATALRATSITQNAGTLTIATELRIRNFGTVASGGFSYRLYLSQDTIVDSGDVELTPTPIAVASLAPNETRLVTSTGTVAKPASASYILASVDLENAAGEPPDRRSNNTAATSVPYSAGVDLVAERITAPLTTGPGDSLTVPIAFTNQGFDPANAPVPIRVWASVDNKLDATDRLLYSTTLAVAGGESVRQNLTFTMPSNIAADTYSLALQLDDSPGVIIEASKSNNLVFSSSKLRVLQPDLVMDLVTVRRAAAPFEQTATAFFGESIRIDAQLRNQGGSVAANVSVQFYLSDNETLNGLSDATIGSITGLTLAPGETRLVTLTANVPTRSPANVLLLPQPYFFFAAAIAPGLGETNSANNAIASVPTLVRGPAPNVLPLSVRGPQRVGAGESVPVTRTLANFGNRPATGVKYRYYLSANTQITVEDTLLPIQTAAGVVNERAIDLGVGAQDSANELVVIPPGVSTAVLYLGVLVDPEGLIDESSRDDNGLAGQQVQVVAQALAVTSSTLPDALVGQPYAVALAARGGNTYTWAAANLPAGLTVSPTGALTGTPTTSGASGFTVTVTSQGRSTQAQLTLRIVNATSSLAITTSSLPAPVRLLPYDAQLGAAGGRAPYTWSIVSGELPGGVALTSSGHLSGAPNDALGTAATFVIAVRDSVGNSDSRAFTVTVVDAAPFQTISTSLPDGVVGSDYLALLAVKNANNTPVATPVTWSVISGTLPDGLRFENSTADTVAVSGTPVRTGLFAFRIEAVDSRGRVAGLNAVVLIFGSAVSVSGPIPGSVTPGTSVSAQLIAAPSQPGATWVVRDGRLPVGLSLSPSGLLNGTVGSDLGAFTFTVGVGAARSELRGLATYRVEVVSSVPKQSGGCSSTGLSACNALFWLLLVSKSRGARRRR